MSRKLSARLAICAAAAAAIPIFARPAAAQYQVDNGHALDANPRLGGNGRNDNPSQVSNRVTGNQIANGNVTNGFAFQGADFHGLDLGTGINDPTQFRGILPGEAIQQFVANSGGVPTNSNPLASSQSRNTRPFYGSISTAGQLPQGYKQIAGGVGYVPSTTVGSQLIDNRVGASYQRSGIPTPKPGDLNLPGPVDVSANNNFGPTALSASQLYGGSSLPPGQQLLMQNYSQAMATIPGQWSSNQPLDPFQVMQFRHELSQNQVQNQVENSGVSQPNSPANSTNSTNSNTNNLTPQPNSSQLVPTPSGDQPASPQNSQPATPQTGQGTLPQSNQFQPQNVAPSANDFTTGQTLDAKVPSPDQQSSQYAQMQQRLKDFDANHSDPNVTNQDYLNQLQAKRDLLNSQNGGQTPLPVPEANSAAGAPASPPVQVGSMASGVGSKGLSDMLKKAESAIAAEKYDEAIGFYNSAMDVAPNNGLILIGRANAELGGSYFRQADSDIRDAFGREQSLLMAQYDLQSLLGDKRLNAVIAELKQIATDSPDSSTPVFLLAYIAYNTHHEDKAAEWLNVAHQRDARDEVIPQISKHWSLGSPATKP